MTVIDILQMNESFVGIGTSLERMIANISASLDTVPPDMEEHFASMTFAYAKFMDDWNKVNVTLPVN